MITKWKRSAVLASIFAAFMTASASATDGSSSSNGLTTVMDYMDEVASLCTSVWNLLTSNPYFAMYLAIGLLSAGLAIFRRAKRVARR